MQGSGQLKVPSVTLPGLGPLVLYEGDFTLPFKDGVIGNFLEQNTLFSIAGWKIRIDALHFLPDGISVTGSIRVPQYAPGLSDLGLAATVDATRSGGVQLAGGSLRIDRIGLSHGLSLEQVAISYDRTQNTFDGSATLKTASLGLQVGVNVVDGCPNGATITILGVPVALGDTGLELVNYGIDGTGFCGTTPFGLGLHTDITIASNPDPDLLSLSGVNAIYFPLTSLRGSGTLRFLHSDLANAQFFFNYSDADVSCLEGLCVQGVLALPSVDNVWLSGRLDGRILIKPFRIYGAQRLTLQLPKSCWDLGLPFLVETWACPIMSTYCGGSYPCVIGEQDMTVTAQPGADPEGILTGDVMVLGHAWAASLIYNEHGDKGFHLRFGSSAAATQSLRVSALATDTQQSEVVIAPGTRDAYLGVRTAAGTVPDAALLSPGGVRYGRDGGSGVSYFEDQAHGAAVFALQNPEPGMWTVDASSGGSIVSYAPDGPISVSVSDVSPTANGYRVTWRGGDPTAAATVSVSYAGSYDGPDAGLIAEGLAASDSDQVTTWQTTAVPAGSYYIRVRILENGGASAAFTWPSRVEVAGNSGLEPPANVRATITGALVQLLWDPSPSPSVAGYAVLVRSGGGAVATEQVVGSALSYDVGALDQKLGYEVWVVSYDADGLRSRPSNVATVAWTPCAPTVIVAAASIATAGDLVNFSPAATLLGCAGETTYDWTFGDGSKGSGPHPQHTYSPAGTYDWSLILGTSGGDATASGTLRVDQRRCSVQVTTPTAGASFVPGKPLIISWTTDGVCGGAVEIDLVKNSERAMIISSSFSGMSYAWTPPPGLLGGEYQLRVSDRANSATTALSQSFTILDSGRHRAVGN